MSYGEVLEVESASVGKKMPCSLAFCLAADPESPPCSSSQTLVMLLYLLYHIHCCQGKAQSSSSATQRPYIYGLCKQRPD